MGKGRTLSVAAGRIFVDVGQARQAIMRKDKEGVWPMSGKEATIMQTFRFILTLAVLQIGVVACAIRPIRIPDAMPTNAVRDAPNVVRVVKKLDAEVIDQSWDPATVRWPELNRGMFNWSATIKNNAPQSRDICVVFHLFNANHRALRGVKGCRVVAPGQEGHITSNAYVDLNLLKQAQTGQAGLYESHTIYYRKSATG
jgi:hypothetical protein